MLDALGAADCNFATLTLLRVGRGQYLLPYLVASAANVLYPNSCVFTEMRTCGLMHIALRVTTDTVYSTARCMLLLCFVI